MKIRSTNKDRADEDLPASIFARLSIMNHSDELFNSLSDNTSLTKQKNNGGVLHTWLVFQVLIYQEKNVLRLA